MKGDDMENQDAFAVALLRPLAEEPTWASRVDPMVAIVEGKRRRRKRRVTGAVTIGLLTVVTVAAGPAMGYLRGGEPEVNLPAVPQSVTVAPSTSTPSTRTPPTVAPISRCTVVRLPTGKHKEAITTGGDPSGRFLLGRSYPKDGSDRPMLIWRDGKLAYEVPLPGDDSSLQDINSSGVAVGYTYVPMKPYVVQDGRATLLPGVSKGQAFAINELGVVVGTRQRNGRSVPVRWPSTAAPAVDLPLPASATEGKASGIFDDGTVVGVVTRKDGSQEGWLWLPEGSSRRLRTPRTAGEFQVRAAHNGWVVGVVGDVHYRYRVDDDRFQSLPAGIQYPDAVAVSGWLAASTMQNAGLVWTGRKTVALPVPAGFRTNPPPFTSVESISDDGRVVGGHTAEYDGDNTAVMWRCR